MALKSKSELDIKRDRMQTLSELIKQGMPTLYELNHYNAKHRHKHTDWENKNVKNIEEWKMLRKEFGRLTSVENLRSAGIMITKDNASVF